MQDNFEYYKQLIIGMTENPNLVTAEDVFNLESVSGEERTKMALYLLSELGVCWEAMKLGAHSKRSNELFYLLLNEFMESKTLSYKDFVYIANNGFMHAVTYALLNYSYPIDLLVDHVYLQNSGPDKEDTNYLGFISLEKMLDYMRAKNLKGVASYLRERIPDSDNMTDEMVLHISGITFEL